MLRCLYKNILWGIINNYLKSIYRFDYDNATSDEIDDLKQRIYSKSLPYLLDKNHLQAINENDLVTRSHLLSLTQNARLLATCRLTPYPFEVNSLLPQFEEHFSDYGNHLEISRLVCIQNRLSPLFLIHAGNAGFRLKNNDGFVGLCTKRHLRSFKKFGLNEILGPITIDDRSNQDYYVIAASYEVMGTRSFMYIVSEICKSNLSYLFSGKIFKKFWKRKDRILE